MGQAALAAEAMVANYDRLRPEVRRSIPADQGEEFDRLFPTSVPVPPNSPAGRLGREASKFNTARTLLGSGPWRKVDQVEIETLEYVDWFNYRRLHGEIGHVPPAEFEETFYASRQEAGIKG
ncbi:MAG: hypothetical protein A2Y55_12540 [Actinobacteria bacterium RBG_16_68_12]|nr:MAG: hypothetical protein A2Y55_12540 [Actinobacteria bacterium RBG_16_68_12]